MRVSIWVGLVTLVLGIILSYLADALITTVTSGALQTTAVLIAAACFVVFSATMLGIGAGLVVHWVIGFATHWKAFIAEIILAFATFFVGIGATIMSGNIWTGVQVFFTFFVASLTLFSMSFGNLYGGISTGVSKGIGYLKSKFTKKGAKKTSKRGKKWKKRGTFYAS
jgi:hypothetical protein